MQGNLVSVIRDYEDFKGAVRTVNTNKNGQHGKRMVLKGDFSFVTTLKMLL